MKYTMTAWIRFELQDGIDFLETEQTPFLPEFFILDTSVSRHYLNPMHLRVMRLLARHQGANSEVTLRLTRVIQAC